MELQERYLVVKHTDLCRSGINDADLATLMRILALVDESRENRGKPPIQSIVIEHDWPEYTPTLEMLSTRVDAETPRSISAKPAFSIPYAVEEEDAEDDSNKGRMLTYKIYIIQSLLGLAFTLSLAELQDLYDKVSVLVSEGKHLDILILLESYINI